MKSKKKMDNKPDYDFPIFNSDTNTIHQFKGEYGWLSNFADCTIEYEGKTYPSVEHAYISAKSNESEWKDLCSSGEFNAGPLKKLSKEIELRDDWEKVKLEIMGKLLSNKFSQEPFKTKLIQTDNKYIEEGNWWGDEFWGVSFKSGKGDNNLGRMIMLIRRLIKQNKL